MNKLILGCVLSLLVSPVMAQSISQPLGVQGPTSATSGHIATFNGTTGQIIQDGGAVGTGTVTSISCNGTTITTTGTCSTVGQIPGTTTNDSASAGNVGEYLQTTVALGSAVSLTSTNVANVASLALTAGDWDVTAVGDLDGAGTTTVTTFTASITTSATCSSSPALPTIGSTNRADTAPASAALASTDIGLIVGPTRISLASGTNACLNVRATFAVSTASAYGQIRARRVR